MKHALLTITTVLILMSFKADVTGPWITTFGGNIILKTRPLNYSKSNSPDSLTIQKIILEQNRVISHINKVLQTNFNSKVQIFLYNYDEAKAKIGTNGGGFVSNKNIYFTYYENTKKTSKDTSVYLGIHEMVHVITNKEMGWPGSQLFGEGFANAIDGTYGRVSIHDRMVENIKNNNIIKPLDLLEKTDIPARDFYPQSGFFIKWLFNNYEIDDVKKLYKAGKTNFAKEFKKITCDDFNVMTEKYLNYCNSFK